MINYWYEVEKESNSHIVIIHTNSDIINTVNEFTTLERAQVYANSYLEGYKAAIGE
ncbi:MAG TPA: hypothetical protein VHZ76_07225 [Gammaproteobacteria bacterium]|jgi:hypothetical protein|nr:hypothetical protein [Gammaproteobacteria bacterium]